MQETMNCLELPNIDLSQIPGLQQKRTLAFINHFVMTNVQFLNSFTNNCEQKLMDFERKLEKVNGAMVLLEARLSSIPELNIMSSISNTTTSEVKEILTADTKTITKESEEICSYAANIHEESNQSQENTDSGLTMYRPEYDRFIKMVQVGVPLQAVKLKLSLEGLDPNFLDEILNK